MMASGGERKSPCTSKAKVRRPRDDENFEDSGPESFVGKPRRIGKGKVLVHFGFGGVNYEGKAYATKSKAKNEIETTWCSESDRIPCSRFCREYLLSSLHAKHKSLRISWQLVEGEYDVGEVAADLEDVATTPEGKEFMLTGKLKQGKISASDSRRLHPVRLEIPYEDVQVGSITEIWVVALPKNALDKFVSPVSGANQSTNRFVAWAPNSVSGLLKTYFCQLKPGTKSALTQRPEGLGENVTFREPIEIDETVRAALQAAKDAGELDGILTAKAIQPIIIRRVNFVYKEVKERLQREGVIKCESSIPQHLPSLASSTCFYPPRSTRQSLDWSATPFFARSSFSDHCDGTTAVSGDGYSDCCASHGDRAKAHLMDWRPQQNRFPSFGDVNLTDARDHRYRPFRTNRDFDSYYRDIDSASGYQHLFNRSDDEFAVSNRIGKLESTVNSLMGKLDDVLGCANNNIGSKRKPSKAFTKAAFIDLVSDDDEKETIHCESVPTTSAFSLVKSAEDEGNNT